MKSFDFTFLPVKLLLFLFLLSGSLSAQKRFKPIDYMVLSTSIWYSTSETDKNSYFNTLQFSYYKGIVKGLNVHFSLPLTISREVRLNGESTQRFAPADLLFYVGYKTNYIEPRIGAVFPLGYGQNIKESWIGSNNTKLYAGVGHKAFTKNKRFDLTGESTFALYINDALYGKNSWSTSHFSKAAIGVHGKIKSGAEIYAFYNHFSKESWQVHIVEKISLGLVPTLFVSYLPNWRYELTLRGGYGFSRYGLKNRGTQQKEYGIINAAVALGVAF